MLDPYHCREDGTAVFSSLDALGRDFLFVSSDYRL
jgi:hypothetical protein